MKRYRAASSLLLALSVLFTGLIALAAPSAQANIQCNDGTGQISCEKNGGPAPTVAPPVSTQTCWNGAVIPVTSACPVPPTTTTTTTTTQTAPSPPVGGCGPNTAWNGTFCAPTTTTTTTPTAPSPPVGGCGPNTYWDGNACVAKATETCWNGAVLPINTCPVAPTTTTTTTTNCPVVGQVKDASGACYFPTTTTTTTTAGSCGTGQVKDEKGTCYFPTTSTTSTVGGGCVPSDWVRTASGACIAPIVGTISSPGTTTQYIQCNDGTGQLSCEKNGGPKATVATAVCTTSEVSIGGVCVSNKYLPTCTATQSSNCIPDTTTTTQFSCPVNGQVRDASGACYFPTTTTTSKIVQCSDGTGQLSCEKNGGTATAYRTCPDGKSLPVSTECSTSSTTTTSKYDCSTAALKSLDVCGGTTKANYPTCSTTQHLEGFNCVSNGITGGVIATSANIKCSDGTFRNTAIECEQSVGGKSTVAITCPINQVVSPSGAYCIYPTTTGTAQGTYRSECAVTPLPASCLVGAPTTFDVSTQMAQKATFNQVLTTELKIQGNNAFDAAGVKVGELAKASNGQVFQAAAPPPPPPSAAGGKAEPKKTAKTSTAPVIVMNVLGADNKEILGPDGKPLQTAPIVKQGNFVYTDSNGSPIMATPTLNASGQAVVHNGKVLMTRLMTIGGNEAMLDSSGKPIMMVPLLGDDGKPLLAPNGEVLYSPPLVNAAGKTMINASTGQAILSRPMADSNGNAALGADKKPFMGQPLVTKDDKLLTVGGQEIYTGAVGMPLTNSKKQQVQTANKQDVQFGFGGTLIDEGGNPVLGPDGKAIVMNANATPLMSNGLPLLDKNGKAVRVSSNGQITDSSGRVILGIDGKAIAIGKSESAEVMKVGTVLKTTVKAPDGSVAVMALNAQLFDKSGNPIVTATGQPIFFDSKSKKLIDPKGNAVKVEAGGKIVGKISSLAFQTVNFAA